MTPLSNIVAVREATAPKSISHFNLFRSATINGRRRRGSARARRCRRWGSSRIACCRRGFSYAWSGVSLEEVRAGTQSAAIFGLGLLLVY
jgi:HAE1 family hydrophobic/amphiphilic exporter-1